MTGRGLNLTPNRTLLPNQQVIKFLSAPKSLIKLCGVYILFRSVEDAEIEASKQTISMLKAQVKKLKKTKGLLIHWNIQRSNHVATHVSSWMVSMLEVIQTWKVFQIFNKFFLFHCLGTYAKLKAEKEIRQIHLQNSKKSNPGTQNSNKSSAGARFILGHQKFCLLVCQTQLVRTLHDFYQNAKMMKLAV